MTFVQHYKRSNSLYQHTSEKIVTYFISYFTCFVILALYSILNFRVGTLSVADLNKYPLNILIYVHNLIGPAALGFVMVIIYYIENTQIVKYFMRQEFLQP